MNYSFVLDENGASLNDNISLQFPYAAQQMELSHYSIPWHWHEEVELSYAKRGSIIVETVNGIYTIKEGEAYFVNANVVNAKHSADEKQNIVIESSHIFHPVLLAGHYQSIYETKYLNPVLHNTTIDVLTIKNDTDSGKEIIKILKKLDQLKKSENNEFEVRNLLSNAWLELTKEIEFQKQNKTYFSMYAQERAKEVLSYIHEKYHEKITISDIAAHINVSERECIRSFKNAFKQTPIEYLNQYRMEQAKKLLIETNLQIKEISYMTGFQNDAYFSKVFKQCLGKTPKEYRLNCIETKNQEK